MIRKKEKKRWLIQTTGKKKKLQRTNLETKQGERIEGTRLKQQINVLEGWSGKKKSVQDSIPHRVLYQDTSRQASWPDSSLVDGHASYTQEGLLMDSKCSIGGLAYLSCVCLMCVCVSLYVTVDMHVTRYVPGTLDPCPPCLKSLCFHFCRHQAKLTCGFLGILPLLPPVSCRTTWIPVHITTPCCSMGPHAYVANTPPTEPSPQLRISGL